MEAKMIEAEFQEFYYWNMEDENGKITVSFKCDVDIKRDLFNFQYNQELNTISLTFSDKIPIILGTLFGKTKGAAVVPSNDRFIIEIEKDEDINWPVLIIKPTPDTNQIDPHSAYESVYLITSDMEKYNNPEIKLGELLKYSTASGYIPAIVGAIKTFINEPEKRNQVIDYLTVLADVYQIPTSIYELGVFLYENDEDREKSLVYLQRAFDLGIKQAAFYLGSAYSPLSEIAYAHKDAEKAFKFFTAALELGDPVVYHEIAKLYHAGRGTPKDDEKARFYQQAAQELDPEIPNLIDETVKEEYEHCESCEHCQSCKNAEEEEPTSLIDVGIAAAATITGAAALFYFAYKFIKK